MCPADSQQMPQEDMEAMEMQTIDPAINTPYNNASFYLRLNHVTFQQPDGSIDTREADLPLCYGILFYLQLFANQ